MSNEQNKTLLRRIYDDVYNRGDTEALSEWVTNDVTDHNPWPGQPRGLKGLRRQVEQLRQAFPDLQVTVEAMMGEGDKVHATVRAKGTHKGDFFGIKATGKSVDMIAMTTVRIQGGRISDWHHVEDLAAFLQQVGALNLGNRMDGEGRKGRNEAQRL